MHWRGTLSKLTFLSGLEFDLFLDALDLLALDKLIDDPFETLASALDHVDDEHALEISLI
jgi:hypothetical protein|tara:strand:+ start:301 stop:480 length:180 start_codon:yes stop_codon:yes gene_type:complete